MTQNRTPIFSPPAMKTKIEMKKDIKQEIQKLIKEIEVYRSHSLFAEAKEKCQKLAKQIRQSDKLKNKKKFLAILAQKIRDMENDIRKFETAGTSVEMPTTEQDIIKKLFHLSTEDGEDSTVVVRAEALLVFGQFEKALWEFNELLKEDSLKVSAAKNILRCHIGLSSLDNGVSQYRDWVSSGRFSPEELGKIHYFFKEILGKKEIDISFPQPENLSDAVENETEDEFIDLLSISIPQYDEFQEEEGVNLDVNFQKGNMISVIMPHKNKALVEYLKVGKMMDNVMFFSPAVIFKDSCVVSETKQILSGPKRGDYSVVMKML
ncbi:MAG: hypothetical protein JRF27_06120 [Deltaproteobacteria bacterium]|nr:hypothetical protein [Deltaproteobacteria bacterium]